MPAAHQFQFCANERTDKTFDQLSNACASVLGPHCNGDLSVNDQVPGLPPYTPPVFSSDENAAAACPLIDRNRAPFQDAETPQQSGSQSETPPDCDQAHSSNSPARSQQSCSNSKVRGSPENVESPEQEEDR